MRPTNCSLEQQSAFGCWLSFFRICSKLYHSSTANTTRFNIWPHFQTLTFAFVRCCFGVFFCLIFFSVAKFNHLHAQAYNFLRSKVNALVNLWCSYQKWCSALWNFWKLLNACLYILLFYRHTALSSYVIFRKTWSNTCNHNGIINIQSRMFISLSG